VPLLHEGGVELLAVTKSMPITVTDAELASVNHDFHGRE
jgi:hypothetical protein